MSHKGPSWRGSFPSIVTPFQVDGMVDEELLRQNVELTVSEGAHGIVIGAHNGESPLMNLSERVNVMRIGIEQVKGRIPVICGAEHVRTELTKVLAEAAKAHGANGILIEAPAYMRPSDDDVVSYMLEVAKVQIPIMVYNQPHRSGFEVTPNLLHRLMAINEVVALMDSAGDFVKLLEFIRVGEERISIFIGTVRMFGFQAVVSGASGFVDGVPQIMGSNAFRLYDLAAKGELQEARVFQRHYEAIGKVLYGKIKTHTYPATLKAAMNILGRPGGYPRLPLRPLDADATALLKKELATAGLTN